jgi:hypothetical protein
MREITLVFRRVDLWSDDPGILDVLTRFTEDNCRSLIGLRYQTQGIELSRNLGDDGVR